MDKIKSYRDLQVWQKAVELSVAVYRITDNFPKSEAYGLTSQMRRAAVSIASNIAEGHRRSNTEFARFLMMALGSLAELETQLEIARRVNYLAEDTLNELAQDADILGRQLNTLHQRVVTSNRSAGN